MLPGKEAASKVNARMERVNGIFIAAALRSYCMMDAFLV